jgi:hypothetical protein
MGGYDADTGELVAGALTSINVLKRTDVGVSAGWRGAI